MLFTLDGTQFTGSITFTGVEGITRILGAVTPQSSGGNGWSFVSWSDDGSANHDILTPTTDTTYTVTYEPAHKALFVVGNATTLGNDAAVVTKLQSWGWDVTIVDDGAATPASANGQDLVLISSSSDVSVGSAFRDVAVPVVLWKPNLYDDLRMTGTVVDTDFGTVTPVRTVDIVGGSPHPLATGGPRTETLTSADVRLPFGQPAGAASIVGTTSGLPSLFTFSPGDAMYGGFIAPSCRVRVPRPPDRVPEVHRGRLDVVPADDRLGPRRLRLGRAIASQFGRDNRDRLRPARIRTWAHGLGNRCSIP